MYVLSDYSVGQKSKMAQQVCVHSGGFREKSVYLPFQLLEVDHFPGLAVSS